MFFELCTLEPARDRVHCLLVSIIIITYLHRHCRFTVGCWKPILRLCICSEHNQTSTLLTLQVQALGFSNIQVYMTSKTWCYSGVHTVTENWPPIHRNLMDEILAKLLETQTIPKPIAIVDQESSKQISHAFKRFRALLARLNH